MKVFEKWSLWKAHEYWPRGKTYDDSESCEFEIHAHVSVPCPIQCKKRKYFVLAFVKILFIEGVHYYSIKHHTPTLAPKQALVPGHMAKAYLVDCHYTYLLPSKGRRRRGEKIVRISRQEMELALKASSWHRWCLRTTKSKLISANMMCVKLLKYFQQLTCLRLEP